MKSGSLAVKIAVPVISALLAFLVGGVLILLTGNNPIEAYRYLVFGAFGQLNLFGETLVKAVPLIFAGLAATFAYRCGIFNLGVEGQFAVGAMASSFVSCNVLANMQGPLNLVVSLLCGCVAGALWAMIPGVLKAFQGLNEMIVTILLNYVAVLFMDYLYTGPLMEANIPQTKAIEAASKMPKLIPGTRVHFGLVLALLVMVLTYYFIFHTARGYQMRVVGLNPIAAKSNGLNMRMLMVVSIVVSGAIAGLGGSVELHGVQFRLMGGFGSGVGFDGVAIALIGQLNPIGATLVAFLFAALRNGANTMQVASGISSSVVDIIQALVIIFAVAGTAAVNLPAVQYVIGRLFPKKKEAATA